MKREHWERTFSSESAGTRISESVPHDKLGTRNSGDTEAGKWPPLAVPPLGEHITLGWYLGRKCQALALGWSPTFHVSLGKDTQTLSLGFLSNK